jgi:hypothetical protein
VYEYVYEYGRGSGQADEVWATKRGVGLAEQRDMRVRVRVRVWEAKWTGCSIMKI